MTGIIDYGAGNLFSLTSSLKALGEDVILLGDEENWDKCSHLILPGVGSFIPARKALSESGLEEKLLDEIRSGKPLLGICLGMQLLFDKGYEEGECPGLGLIPGSVISIKKVIPEGYKIPHIGWNRLRLTKPSPLLRRTKDGECVYFVHSYYAKTGMKNISSVTDYGAPLTASVEKDNVYGVQFHPEKSGRVGLGILESFLEIK
jgi:imidazole glycerol-phosphate synthase subunit HisH